MRKEYDFSEGDMECKYWLDQDHFDIEEDLSYNMSPKDQRQIRKIIYDHFSYAIQEKTNRTADNLTWTGQPVVSPAIGHPVIAVVIFQSPSFSRWAGTFPSDIKQFSK
jgi:hypothetical protein